MRFQELQLSDGKIEGIELQRRGIVISVRDWREAIYRLSFIDSPGFDVALALDEDLSGIFVSTDQEFVRAICQRSGDDPEGQMCYSFVSAWSDRAILRVVSRIAPTVESGV